MIKDGTHGSHPRQTSGIPLLSAKDIGEDGTINLQDCESFISEREYELIHRSYMLQTNDVLLTIVGTLGNRAIILYNTPIFTIQRGIAVIRANLALLLPNYLYHFVISNYFQRNLIIRSHATAQAGVYLKELANIEMAFPSSLEQHRIATILNTLDTQIQQTEHLIAMLKQIKIGLLHDLFTRGVDENGDVRDPVAHPEKFKKSALGSIPRVWNVPRDAQRADKKEIAGRRRKERPLMGKKCVIFPEGGLSSYDIQPLY